MDGISDQVGKYLFHRGRVAPCRRQLVDCDFGPLASMVSLQRVDDLRRSEAKIQHLPLILDTPRT